MSRTKGTAPNEETETFSWDATNRLVSYQPHAGGSTSYDYDPFTRRVRKATPTETTWYVWDGDVLLAEYRQEGVGPLATTHREVWYGYAGGFTPVLVGQVGACGNGVDDDGDGNADFPLDADCASPEDDTEATTSPGANQCTDATDNDGDTLSDGSDPDCLLDAVEGPEPAVGQCDDGVDNDGQNGTDFPTDGSCLWAADATEGPEPASGQCADSLDNDGDGDFDGADDDCSASLDETEGAEPRVYAVHADHLGTPRLLTDLEGRPVWRALYAAYGRAVVESGSGVEFNVRFPGQYFDGESGLHYNRFRYYSPELGRYISADPLGQFGELNLYSYVKNRPVEFVDPLGLLSFKPGVPQNTLQSKVRDEFDLIDSVAINEGVSERVVTSTTDVADGRVENTRHGSGNAIDLRCRDLTDAEQDELAEAIAEGLGMSFDVISEHFPQNPVRDHIHIEYDPRPDKTSNFSVKTKSPATPPSSTRAVPPQPGQGRSR